MILVGDYVPKAFRVKLPKEFCDKLILANLEGPILLSSDERRPMLKSGPHICNDECGFAGFGDSQVVFSLANNHIMDYGVDGLLCTKRFLREHGMVCVGAGVSIEEARKSVVVKDGGREIGIIACREAQFGSVNCADWGWWVFDEIKNLRPRVDAIVVSCHAAFEDSPFPSPWLRAFYHQLIDAGVAVVHGHHSHVPQGWERYCGGVIFYGLGNFAVDVNVWKRINNRWSVVVDLDFSGSDVQFSVRSLECVDSGNGSISIVHPGAELEEYQRQYLEICKKALKDDESVAGYWQESASRFFHEVYANAMHFPAFAECRLSFRERVHYARYGLARLFEAIFGCRRVSSRSFSGAVDMYNYCQCQSHLEMIKAACGFHFGNEMDFRTEEIKENFDKVIRPNLCKKDKR